MSTWEAGLHSYLEDAVTRPASGPATLGEVWEAGQTAHGLQSSAVRQYEPLAEATSELEDALQKATGTPFQQLATSAGVQPQDMGYVRRAQVASVIAEGLPAQQRQQVEPYLDVRGNAAKKAQAALADVDETGARTYGVAANAVSFLSQAVGAMLDPVNLAATIATVPLSGGMGGALVPFLAREAAANAAAQALQEPFIQSGRAELGLSHGFGEAATNIAVAGLAGAGLAGLLRGGASVLRRARGAEAAAGRVEAPEIRVPEALRGVDPDDIDAVAVKVETEALFDSLSFDPSPAGRMVDAARVDEMARALELGRPGTSPGAAIADLTRIIGGEDASRLETVQGVLARNEAAIVDLDRHLGSPGISAVRGGLTRMEQIETEIDRLKVSRARAAEHSGPVTVADIDARIAAREAEQRSIWENLDGRLAQQLEDMTSERAARQSNVQALRAELESLRPAVDQARQVATRRYWEARNTLSSPLFEGAPEHVTVAGMGPNGLIVDGLQNDFRLTAAVLQRMQSGEARGVLSHPDVPGPINVAWGDGVSGLARIIDRHPEAVAGIPDQLAAARVIGADDRRIVLGGGDASSATIRLDYDSEAKAWLLSAYDAPPRIHAAANEGATPGAARGGDIAGGAPDAGGASAPAQSGRSGLPSDPDEARRIARHAEVTSALASRGDIELHLDDGRVVSAKQILADIDNDRAAAAELADCVRRGGA